MKVWFVFFIGRGVWAKVRLWDRDSAIINISFFVSANVLISYRPVIPVWSRAPNRCVHYLCYWPHHQPSFLFFPSLVHNFTSHWMLVCSSVVLFSRQEFIWMARTYSHIGSLFLCLCQAVPQISTEREEEKLGKHLPYSCERERF